MPSNATEFRVILAELTRADVEFIVIGGVAAALHGSPVVTQDIDIVHRRSPSNAARLAAALARLDARYREHGEKRLRPTGETLMLPGAHLLDSSRGRIDVLGTVIGGEQFEALVGRTVEYELGDGLVVRVLDLEKLIEMKTALGRPRDQYAVIHLEALLAERRRLGMPRDG